MALLMLKLVAYDERIIYITFNQKKVVMDAPQVQASPMLVLVEPAQQEVEGVLLLLALKEAMEEKAVHKLLPEKVLMKKMDAMVKMVAMVLALMQLVILRYLEILC